MGRNTAVVQALGYKLPDVIGYQQIVNYVVHADIHHCAVIGQVIRPTAPVSIALAPCHVLKHIVHNLVAYQELNLLHRKRSYELRVEVDSPPVSTRSRYLQGLHDTQLVVEYRGKKVLLRSDTG